jgi:predicted nucleic acid-binding protein
MTGEPFPWVIDASVGIKLFIKEEDSEKVQRLFEQLLADAPDSIFVPDLFFIECANILWKKVRRGEYRADLAEADLEDLITLNLPATPTSELMARAFQLANKYNITAYDACYIALAERLQVPLLTADERMEQVFAGHPSHSVRLLQDLL